MNAIKNWLLVFCTILLANGCAPLRTPVIVRNAPIEMYKYAWYDLYDESGKKYKTLSESIGSFVSISGDTFIVRRSAWLDTYDRTGKKINTRSAY